MFIVCNLVYDGHIKANNALIAPKLALEAKKVQAKINQNNLYSPQVIEYNPMEFVKTNVKTDFLRSLKRKIKKRFGRLE